MQGKFTPAMTTCAGRALAFIPDPYYEAQRAREIALLEDQHNRKQQALFRQLTITTIAPAVPAPKPRKVFVDEGGLDSYPVLGIDIDALIARLDAEFI